FYRQVVPLGLKKLHRSEMFVKKWKNSVFKAPSGRPVCFEKFNRTIMIKNKIAWLNDISAKK
ncbi:MAG: hypothetical protein Q8S41_11455, partial [Lutibacter sp.]|nr:hypothetical protein [Lutibacter sp.]